MAEVTSGGRWQDWAAVVIGAVAALSPLWTDTSHRSAWTMVILGVLLALTGLWSLAQPASVGSEYSHMFLGAVLFLAPWVMNYTGHTGAAWTSWIGGLLAVLSGLIALPEANTAHRIVGHRS
ncbi:MAG: SPW repeat protein [Mycobacteriaceae bacterium]|nr:SPW repeat protein [Mycobacteriaceae bacterium]